jgi:hypothetical protein
VRARFRSKRPRGAAAAHPHPEFSFPSLSISRPLPVNPSARLDHNQRRHGESTVKYMLLIYGGERVWASTGREEMERIYAAHRAYGEALTKAGALVGGAELQPVASATTVRFARGRPPTTDGPFAETKEQLAGYDVIAVENLDQAITCAEKMPGMTDGTVEIRPYALAE